HRVLWAAVQDLQLDVRRACVAAMKCAGLSRADADLVGRQWYHQQAGLGWKGAFDLLEKLVIEADPALAAKKQAQAAATREVVFWGHREGAVDMTARMDVLDAKYLDATIEQIAGILLSDSANTGFTKQVMRAKALGVMATPALALALQQQGLVPRAAEQPELLSGDDCVENGATPAATTSASGLLIDPDTGRIDRDPQHCLGHVCGRVTVPPAKLQPRAKVYLHIEATDLNRLGGAVLVEKAGWISSLTLKSMLGGKKITIQPVIDLNRIPAEFQYAPSARMREATQLLCPTEMFPFSHTPSRGLELDHTVAYRRSCRDAQTGIGLLAPLHHKVHHAKTVGAWNAQQPIVGEIFWTSPLGFQYVVTPERTYALE
ncbi:MAG: hypothetical protein ABIS84_04305, partial [Arachnia sp.]